MKKTTMIYVAIAAVAGLILYAWWKTRARVLDPSNSQALSDLFDQLNPTIGGKGNPNTGIIGPNLAGLPQNYIPFGKGVPIGESPPIIVIDHRRPDPVYA